MPDCANITRTASTHAAQLVEAGFDYVAVDITNWPVVNAPTDLAVLRPTEVLFEEWLKLRQAGQKTPQIAVWPCSPDNSNTWQYLLTNLYNNATYDSLIYRDPQSNKKVVFLPDNPSCYSAAVETMIRSNGGRNDIETRRMWALFGGDKFASGTWGFFSPCTTTKSTETALPSPIVQSAPLPGRNSSAPPLHFTTSMVGEEACNQAPTLAADGSVVEVTASGGYMLSQCALPFASPGHMRGLTLHRLFTKVLATGAPNLFVSSFNEHIGGRQAPAYKANTAINIGLPDDPQRAQVWVDTYAAEFSRDIEPSVEGGSRVWEVAKACVQLYKQALTCADQPASPCCTTADKYVYANVWSLAHPGVPGDHLLTNSAGERAALLGEGWQEICNPVGGPSVFCVDGSMQDGRAGPFMLFNTTAAAASTVPLYRCITAAGHHLFSAQADCEGLGKNELTLGYMAASRGGDCLRALRRCRTAAGDGYLHSLDLPCDHPDSLILGFVR